jgi:UDPglucose--hexose-1-phosphate uridylyltransferase
MPEIRQNIATKEWVIIATERARRSDEFRQSGRELTQDRPPWDAKCPFCPGNEEPAQTEQMRIPAEGPWQLRAVLNKFPALALDGERQRHFAGINRWLSGVGRHEVIIETPLHNTCPALETPEEVARTMWAFQARGADFSQDARIEQVVYFKNHGPLAGTSMAHAHAQIVGLPMVPSHIRSRAEEARRYFDDSGDCVYCVMLNGELADAKRIIASNEHFVAFIPYAAFSPFHTWILPRRHCAGFLSASQSEVAALGHILRDVLRRLYIGLRDPDYNYVIRSGPIGDPGYEYMHWYLTIIPHVTKAAGFEMGSGMFINTALPEESAAFLRETDPDGSVL